MTTRKLTLSAETLRLFPAPVDGEPAEKRTARCRPSYGKCVGLIA